MFSITAQDVIHLGRSPGGDRFTQFVDALIRAHCYACSTPQSSISTNLRTNIRDGGVDTRVSQPATGDRDKIQWMRDKTIWQYKATDASQVIPSLLQKEVGNQQERRYSTECIEQGYAYRFCVCAGEADCKKVEWENTLNQAIRAIQSDALDARVLTADDLAAWANQFPALILEFFRPRMADAVLHLNAWKQNITDATPLFMNVPTWEPIQQEIRRHLDFGSRPVEVLLSVQGEAGASGKPGAVQGPLQQKARRSDAITSVTSARCIRYSTVLPTRCRVTSPSALSRIRCCDTAAWCSPTAMQRSLTDIGRSSSEQRILRRPTCDSALRSATARSAASGSFAWRSKLSGDTGFRRHSPA